MFHKELTKLLGYCFEVEYFHLYFHEIIFYKDEMKSISCKYLEES